MVRDAVSIVSHTGRWAIVDANRKGMSAGLQICQKKLMRSGEAVPGAYLNVIPPDYG
jgi:hypothetical protein